MGFPGITAAKNSGITARSSEIISGRMPMETITATERPQDRTGAGTSTRAYGSIVPSDPVDVVYIARLRDCQEQKAYMQSSHIAPQLWAGDKPNRALAGMLPPDPPRNGGRESEAEPSTRRGSRRSIPRP